MADGGSPEFPALRYQSGAARRSEESRKEPCLAAHMVPGASS